MEHGKGLEEEEEGGEGEGGAAMSTKGKFDFLFRA